GRASADCWQRGLGFPAPRSAGRQRAIRGSGSVGADGAGAVPADRSPRLGRRCVHRRLPESDGHGATGRLTVGSTIITALEHQTLSVDDGPDAMLRPHEAARLLELGASRPGFCTAGNRSVKLAQYAGLVNLGGRMLEVLPK